MKMKCFELRLRPDRVEALRELARRRAFERKQDCSWADLVREGVDLVLQGQDVVRRNIPNESTR